MTAAEQEEKERLLEEVWSARSSPWLAVFCRCSRLLPLVWPQGFSTWTRRDFNTFIRACEKYGRSDVKSISSEMDGKSEEEVERYAKAFKERYKELNGEHELEPSSFISSSLEHRVDCLLPAADYDRIIKNIERGEARISRKDEIMKAIGKKMDRYKNPWLELKIQYGQNKGKLYNEECDRFMVSHPPSLSLSRYRLLSHQL